jgi:hypothetical protein
MAAAYTQGRECIQPADRNWTPGSIQRARLRDSSPRFDVWNTSTNPTSTAWTICSLRSQWRTSIDQ